MAETAIEYEILPEDLITFQSFHLENSPSYIRQRRILIYGSAIIFLLMPAILGSIMYINNPRPDFSNWLLEQTMFTGIFALLWVIIVPPFLKGFQKNLTKKAINEGDSSGLFGHKKLLLTEKKFKAIDDTSETIVKWVAIEKVVENDEHIFMYNSAVSAFIIPKRAFKTENEKNQFVRDVKSYIEKASTL